MIKIGTEVFDLPSGQYFKVTAIEPASGTNGPLYCLNGAPTDENYPTEWRTEFEISTAIIHSMR